MQPPFEDAAPADRDLDPRVAIPPARFEQEDAVRIAYEMAAGVAEAHGLGVVHRDLKPENVFITRADVVKVLDFGIAKFLGWGYHSTGRMRGVLGTPSYMSPEQAEGAPVDAGTDIWAVGAVMYELISGTRPFLAPSAALVVEKIRSETPARLATIVPGLPPAVDDLVHQALERERHIPDNRVSHRRPGRLPGV